MDNQTEKYYLKNARLNFSNEVDKHNLPIELLKRNFKHETKSKIQMEW